MKKILVQTPVLAIIGLALALLASALAQGGASYSVAVGPYEYPEAGASGTYAVPGYTYTVNLSGDTQTINSAYDGTIVIFRHTLRNTGNTSDSFTLGFSGAPPGWNCSLLDDNLTSSIGTTTPVGPVAAGADYNFALKCQIPAGATGGPFNLLVGAVSVGDSSKTDSTTDTVSNLADGFRLDLYGGVNLDPPYTNSQTIDGINDTSDSPHWWRPDIYPSSLIYSSANPGGQVVYRLRVKNLNPNGQADNYILSVQPEDGYTDRVDSVLFYADANDDGVPDGGPITSTGTVAANGEFKYLAVVTLKSNAPAQSADFTFVAKSTQSSTEPEDFVPTFASVNTVLFLAPDVSGTVTSPGTIQYMHILSINQPYPACEISGDGGTHGWTYKYSLDGTTWQDSPFPLRSDSNSNIVTQPIYVRVTVPAGAPIGTTDVNTLTALCYVGDTDEVHSSVTETTAIVGGELRLIKSGVSYVGSSTVRSADGSQAYPGDQIEYTVVAQNIGIGNLSQVVITDPLPSFASFVSVSASISGFSGTVLYSTDGSTWSPTAPTTLASGQSIYVAVDTNGDSTISSADVMPPAAKITITFRVQVQ